MNTNRNSASLGLGLLTAASIAVGGCVSEQQIREVREAADRLAQQLDGPSESENARAASSSITTQTEQDQRIIETARSIAPYLPPTVQAPLLVALGLSAGMLRAGQLKRALASVARGIEKAKQEDRGFRDAFDRSADRFRSTQTPAARRVVDETTRERFMVRLPV